MAELKIELTQKEWYVLFQLFTCLREKQDMAFFLSLTEKNTVVFNNGHLTIEADGNGTWRWDKISEDYGIKENMVLKMSDSAKSIIEDEEEEDE